MKAPKLKYGQAVRVSWYDSQTKHGWQYNTQTAGGIGKIQSLGYVVTSNEKFLLLTTSIDGQTGAGLDPVGIPWKAIVTLEKLPENWNR